MFAPSHEKCQECCNIQKKIFVLVESLELTRLSPSSNTTLYWPKEKRVGEGKDLSVHHWFFDLLLGARGGNNDVYNR